MPQDQNMVLNDKIHEIDISEKLSNLEVPIALKAVGKYLMRSLTRDYRPDYDATLTLSKWGIQVPLFHVKTFNDKYSASNLPAKLQGVSFNNHHFVDNQSITIITEVFKNDSNKSYDPEKFLRSDEENQGIVRFVGVLLAVLNTAHTSTNVLDATSSLPSVRYTAGHFEENPFGYDPASYGAILRIFLDVIMQQGLEVDFETPTKVYKNMIISNISSAHIDGAFLGSKSITLTLSQNILIDMKIVAIEEDHKNKSKKQG